MKKINYLFTIFMYACFSKGVKKGMRRAIFFVLLGGLTMIELPAYSAPIGAYNQIIQAVQARNESALKYLISVGLNINATNMQGKTALCTTVETQDYEGYELLLSQGATVRTPCMRDMDPKILNKFVANQPPLGTYYDGAILTASRSGLTMGNVKAATETISSLPYPHLGEILLGGVAVGAALAVGTGGSSGGGDDPGPDVPKGKYASPFQKDNPTKSNYLISSYFSDPKTQTELLATKPSDATRSYTDYMNEYNAVNTTGIIFKDNTGAEIYSQNYLSQINAADAYARGYSGYKISRDSEGNPTAAGWAAVTNEKVKVAVMDNGLFYNQDLDESLFKKVPLPSNLTYYQSIGKNYVYGTKPSPTNPYWSEASSGEGFITVNLIENSISGKVLASRKFIDEEVLSARNQWEQYRGQFAPICDLLPSESSTACLKKVAEQELPETNVKRYIVSYFANPEASESSEGISLADYYVYSYLWDQYKAKYGESGYEYDVNDATGTFFQGLASNVDHGTHVVGLIGALRNGMGTQGVAYNVDITPIKLDLEMTEDVNHILDAVQTGSRIVNLSFGYKTKNMSPAQKEKYLTSNKESVNYDNWQRYKEDYAPVLYHDEKRDQTALVFSAGNDGEPQSTVLSVAPKVDPDNYKDLLINVIALGNVGDVATYHKETGDIASYSNRCGATASYCLAAPGGDGRYGLLVNGISEYGESSYAMRQGTSLAAPIVSGSLAVLMGAFPFLTTKQAVQILLTTATYIPAAGEEIEAYNDLAEDPNAYAVNTVEGEYNAIYGRGLVNLDRATDPIGLPKITFDTVATSTNSVPMSASSARITAMVANTLNALPKNLIVLDDYTRAYQVSTKSFIKPEKRTDRLRRSFRSFMAQDEKEIVASDTLSFTFSQAPVDKKDVQTGSMSVVMRPNKNIQMRFGFREDTASFGNSYVGRSLQNPFMNMRQAIGSDVKVQFAKNWALTGSWHFGKNGFVDEDIFDKMSHQSHMQLIESGVAYQGIKDFSLGISGGIMDEEDSLFGTRGSGAFKTDGAQTRFVRVMANYQPTDKFRLSGSYTYGMTEANKASSLMSYSRLVSDSFAMVAEYMPDDKQTFGIKLVSPLRIRSGSASFNLPVARDLYEDRIYRETFTAGLKPAAREYDLSFYYSNELSSALSLAGETGVRLNPDHQSEAEPDYRALFKLNWIW